MRHRPRRLAAALLAAALLAAALVLVARLASGPEPAAGLGRPFHGPPEGFELPPPFRFFYVGHAYGRPKGYDYWRRHDVAPPARTLVENLRVLRRFDLGVFGGDVLVRCDEEHIRLLERRLLAGLPLPLFNSAGNHDACLPSHYGYPRRSAAVVGGLGFVVLSSAEMELSRDDGDWLIAETARLAAGSEAAHVFVFTHRPFFLQLSPDDADSALAAGAANHPLAPANEPLRRSFAELEDRLAGTGKHLYWFAGDVGVRYPLLYQQRSERVRFVASGLNESELDHLISVSYDGDRVTLSVMGLGGHRYGDLEAYDLRWVRRHLQRTSATPRTSGRAARSRSGASLRRARRRRPRA